MDQLQWGYQQAVPAEASVVWGARAITSRTGLFDLLPDRQDFRGDQGLVSHLVALLYEGAAVRRMQDSYKAALDAGVTEGHIDLIDHGVLKAAGRLSPTFDYLYVAAWLTVDVTCLSLLHQAPAEGLSASQAVWSGPLPPPAVGSLIEPTCADWALAAQAERRMKVLGYGVSHGHLMAWGILQGALSAQKIQQDDRAWHDGRWAPRGCWNVMGREWRPVGESA